MISEEIREGKYVQVIAITYEPDKWKKESLKIYLLGLIFGKGLKSFKMRRMEKMEGLIEFWFLKEWKG